MSGIENDDGGQAVIESGGQAVIESGGQAVIGSGVQVATMIGSVMEIETRLLYPEMVTAYRHRARWSCCSLSLFFSVWINDSGKKKDSSW